MPFSRSLLPLLLALPLLAFPVTARGDEDPEVARLNAATNVLKSNVVPAGKTERYGHAEILINAPIARVRQLVQDYGHYKEFAPSRFQNSRIVAKRPNETDVYLQIPIMNGLVTLWGVTRFGPPKPVSPGVEVIEGRQVKGNLKDLHVVWTLRSLGDNFTVLKCDLLLLLNMTAPQAAVDEELRDAAGQAADSIWVRAQNGVRKVVPFGAAKAAPAPVAKPAPSGE